MVGPRIPTPDEPWQCVPVEITKEMQHRWMFPPGEQGWPNSATPSERYRSMLDAAPKPEDG